MRLPPLQHLFSSLPYHPTICLRKCSTEHFLPFSNSILRASIEKGFFHKALSDYNFLLLSTAFHPDHRTYLLLLKACNNSSNLKVGTEIHARITKTGFISHWSVLITIFRLYVDHDSIVEAHPLFDDVMKWNTDPFFGNLLIMGVLKKREFENAYRVFKEMPVRDLISWNSMIVGSVKSLRYREAMSLFNKMIHLGFEPDGFSFSSVLSACARVGAGSYGEWVHQLMVDKGMETNYIIASALVDMYAKCGNIEMAKTIFNSILRTHVSIWNSMISGLAIHGLGSNAIEVFLRMECEGMIPDGITFVALLTVCSHCGMIEHVRNLFNDMKAKYSIEPKIEHYGAFVDALARAGLLDEAYDIVTSMSIKPDNAIWRALLSACRKHGRVELAEVVIRQMASGGSGDYVMLSSIYSAVKRWDCAERVWEVMKEEKVRKNRGLSWVELGGRIHQFKAGDRTHIDTNDIYRVVDALSKRVKAEGFLPMTEVVSTDVLEEEREENLRCHSEKLAVAYCVLKTGPGAEIRVSKNLRACRDCHQWLKMVSKVLGRVIVVRDRIRFHRFEKGSCSCKDYW
ncbi:pentatricopeptide repeat-containing protein At5g50990 [Ananas comosus]|uniref:Pentatricopeptide repeat-containing protein At5g50990 n=1 Tax=Ananas comosus TaxID=4615 RepID=A0A6P5GNE7_ANACO|nr:pentatricopeptide repeat-containing protein At5g50990 [Ananas comosus]